VNMRFRISLLLLSTALAMQAQMQMNVQQLVDFIRSELALKQHTDKQVAAYVKKIQLSERLTDKTILDLEAQGAQPKTVEALHVLRDQTASIKRTAAADVTSSPATAPDNTLTAGPPTAQLSATPVQPPAPDSVHQQQILDLMRQYAQTYAQGLPNYICVRVDRRYLDPRGGDNYRSLGTILARVSYNQGQEQYKIYSDRDRIVDPELGGFGGGGARSSGEFAAMMESIFDSRSNAEFGWEKWGKLRGRVLAVFNYFIDSGHSSYTIGYSEGPHDEQHIYTAYRGTVWADANTGEIDRITFDAVNIPTSFPVRSAHEQIDYDVVAIGDQQAILPLYGKLNMTTLRAGSSKNDFEFRNYHKYGADTVIHYDMEQASAAPPPPLPTSKTEEQPVTGSAPQSNPGKANTTTPQQPAKAASSSNPWTLPTAPPPPPQ
jgi:hypothetical protein